MEHLYIPKQSTHTKVPLACTSIYDGQGFDTYPERYAKAQGWDNNKDIDLAREKYGDLPAEEIEKFLQSWLYFGTIAEFFFSVDVKVEVDLNSFADKDNGCVTTKNLRKLMVRWINPVVRRREHWEKEWKKKVRAEHNRLKALHGGKGDKHNLVKVRPELDRMESDASVMTILAEDTEENLTLRENDRDGSEKLQPEDKDDPIKNAFSIARKLGKPDLEKREDWKNAEKSLSVLRSYLQRYCPTADASGTDILRGDTSASHPLWPVRGEITMSMISLGWTLQAAAAYACNLSPSTEEWSNTWFISRFLVRTLLDMGHCKMDVSRLSQFVQIDGLYYAATSVTAQGTRIHDSCTEWECSVPSIDEALYIQRHAAGCGNTCGELVGPNITNLVEIIQSGKTPLVRWIDGTEGGVPRLETGYCGGPEDKYIAISHVWSDGMGNPLENILPACVIQDIQKRVDLLYIQVEGEVEGKDGKTKRGPTWIWLDTLCIPVQKENYRYRIMSIERMRGIYTDADKVLVLDSWIQELPDTAEGPEVLLRLFFSEWIHRLWTLQEGAFANEVYYQLKGKAVSSRATGASGFELHKSLEKKAYFTQFPMIVQHNVDDVFQSSGFLGSIMKDYYENDGWTATDAFGWLMHSWSYRRTSHRTDECICMATLLKMDPQELLHIHEKNPEETADRRQEWFFSRVSKFCKQVIFHRSERGVKDGLRWAPRSFLKGRPLDFIREPEMEGPEDTGNASYSDGVLTINYPGLRYQGNGVDIKAAGSIILQPEEPGKQYLYRLTLLEKTDGMSIHENSNDTGYSVIIRAIDIATDQFPVSVGQKFEALAGSIVEIRPGSTRFRPESVAVLDIIGIKEAENENVSVAQCSELHGEHTWNIL